MRALYNKECDKGEYVNRKNPEQIRLEGVYAHQQELTRQRIKAAKEPTPADIAERLAQHKFKKAFYAVLRTNPGRTKEWCEKRTRELLGLPDPVREAATRAEAKPAKTPIFYRAWNAATAAAYNITTSEDAGAVQYR